MPYKDVSSPARTQEVRVGGGFFCASIALRVDRRGGMPASGSAIARSHPRRPTCGLRYTRAMVMCAYRSQVIPANEARRVRWKNRLGWTREIHAALPSETAKTASADHATAHTAAHATAPDHEHHAWDWRLSIAEIEGDAPFSLFPGVERELVLLRGDALRLCFDDGGAQILTMPHGRARFAGERAMSAEPGVGITHVFNLMWRRDAVDAQLLHRPLVGPMLFFAQPDDHWALYLLAGDARFDAATGLPPMAAGDTALLHESRRTRFMLDGGGELLAIRLRTPGSSEQDVESA